MRAQRAKTLVSATASIQGGWRLSPVALGSIETGGGATGESRSSSVSRCFEGLLMLTRRTVVDRPFRTRAAVSNGTRIYPKGVDGRSAEARRFKDLVSSFAASLGGEGALTEAERALIRNATLLTLQSERLQAVFVAGREVNSEELTRLANSSARVLAALRIKHERKEAAPTLPQYLAAVRKGGPPR
jgi:hypothetical protein